MQSASEQGGLCQKCGGTHYRVSGPNSPCRPPLPSSPPSHRPAGEYGPISAPKVASEQVTPAGMKPWSGGDSAPEDWDGGPVLEREGSMIMPARTKHRWAYLRAGHHPTDIVAYTPSPAPMVEQAGEVIQADREAAADYLAHANPSKRGQAFAARVRAGGHPDATLVAAFARHRLNTRPAPAETEGVEEDVIERAAAFAHEQRDDDKGEVWNAACDHIANAFRHEGNPLGVAFNAPSAGIGPQERINALTDALVYARENLGDPVPIGRRHVARKIDAVLSHASTPPADAGMQERISLHLSNHAGDLVDAGYPDLARSVYELRDEIDAALSSQAHQIREGDHG